MYIYIYIYIHIERYMYIYIYIYIMYMCLCVFFSLDVFAGFYIIISLCKIIGITITIEYYKYVAGAVCDQGSLGCWRET